MRTYFPISFGSGHYCMHVYCRLPCATSHLVLGGVCSCKTVWCISRPNFKVAYAHFSWNSRGWYSCRSHSNFRGLLWTTLIFFCFLPQGVTKQYSCCETFSIWSKPKSLMLDAFSLMLGWIPGLAWQLTCHRMSLSSSSMWWLRIHIAWYGTWVAYYYYYAFDESGSSVTSANSTSALIRCPETAFSRAL